MKVFTINLALFGLYACSSAKHDTTDSGKAAAPKVATVPAPEVAPPFELGSCGVAEETFDGALQVTGEIDGQPFGAACVAGTVEVDRLGTTEAGLAYNIVCKSADGAERLSFWLKGFVANVPFGTRDEWGELPNISLQADSGAGQLKRHSFGPQPEHVERLGGVVWLMEGGIVGMTPPFPEHRLKGCVEGKFVAFDAQKTGSIKVLFDVKAR